MKKGLIIAIDGPAGSGKSTVARLVAKKLNYLYMDTGATYRAVTWKAMRDGVNLEDEEALIKLARETKVELKKTGDGLEVYVDGRDVTKEIRDPEVTNNVFYLARLAGVRERMVKIQRQMGTPKGMASPTPKGMASPTPKGMASPKEGGVIVEGRDIGTVVFPRADYKFYLDASLKERTQRRFKELKDRGHKVEFNEVKEEIKERDGEDKGRKIAPLKIAEGAIVIDSTKMNIEEEVELILKHIKD